jgi:NAD-dependent DNA ligase
MAGSWTRLAKDPVAQLRAMSLAEVAAVMQQLQSAYYNSAAPRVADDVYDIVKEHLRGLDPTHPLLDNVGAAVAASDHGQRKVTLPVYMGSLDKIKADPRAVDAFKAEYPGAYVVSDKLDGNSALVRLGAGGGARSMYSRGNGEVGLDISHLVPFIRGVPTAKALKKPCTVRGELIIPRASWARAASASGGSNARNTVSGVVNARVPDLEVAKHVVFVAYAVVEPPLATVGKQMAFLRKHGFVPVPHRAVAAADLDVEWLSAHLAERREASDYEIDGVVVAHDQYHPVVRGRNPAAAFAFKHLLTQATAEVVVTQVEWHVSKDGLLKPTVVFLPVTLGGVTIRRATGFNADFIRANVIGPGAHLLIVRSGDVIPHILSVAKPAPSGQAQMPDAPYAWSGAKDVRTLGATAEQDLRVLARFFEKLEVRGLGEATVARLVDAGATSVRAILELPADNGIVRPALLEDINRTVRGASCVALMHASNAFGSGLGERKLTCILRALPRLATAVSTASTASYAPTVEQLTAVEGVSAITADKFLVGLRKFRQFMVASGLRHCVAPPAAAATAGSKWAGQTVVFTGFRNKPWEDAIKAGGGAVGASITAKTTLVVARDPDASSGKLKAAADKGIQIVGMDAFEP